MAATAPRQHESQVQSGMVASWARMLASRRDETRSKRFREIVSFAQGFSELGSNGRGIRRLLEIVVSLLHGGTVVGPDE